MTGDIEIPDGNPFANDKLNRHIKTDFTFLLPPTANGKIDFTLCEPIFLPSRSR